MTGISQVRRGDIDGVRTVWVPGRGTTLRASLVFRVGMVDTHLLQSGWIHLLEHLALHGLGSARRAVNGSTSLLITTFDVAAEPDEVCGFLAEVCRWLSNPVLNELERETRVLRAESAQRQISAPGRHLLWRYGATGPGLAAFPELGLHRLDEGALRDLAGSVFVRDNAMLALSGPPPASMRLPLTDGSALPLPSAVACEQPYPGVFEDRVGGIGVSGEVPRSAAATILGRTLQRTLEMSIRERSGSGYQAWASYEAVDTTTAVVFAGSDVLQDARSGLVAETVRHVRQLAIDGGSASELADEIGSTIRLMSDDADAQWQPWSCVRSELLSGEPFDVDDFIGELQSVATEDIARAAQAFVDSLLVGVDPGTAPGYLPVLRAPSQASMPEGRRFTHVDAPLNEGTLVIGDRLAAASTPDGYLAASFDDLAGVMAYPDGGRCLIRRDGYQLLIEPSLWRAGKAAVDAIDATLDPTLVVRMPERRADEIPKPRVDARLRRKHWIQRHWLTLEALSVLALVIGAITAAVVTGNPRLGFIALASLIFARRVLAPRR